MVNVPVSVSQTIAVMKTLHTLFCRINIIHLASASLSENITSKKLSSIKVRPTALAWRLTHNLNFNIYIGLCEKIIISKDSGHDFLPPTVSSPLQQSRRAAECCWCWYLSTFERLANTNKCKQLITFPLYTSPPPLFFHWAQTAPDRYRDTSHWLSLSRHRTNTETDRQTEEQGSENVVRSRVC